MNSKINCTCGWSWNKSDSSKKDMYICHECGRDNKMKDGGWLDSYEDGGEIPQAQQGENLPATRKDSLNLQKNYLLKEQQLKNLGYRKQTEESGSYPEAHSLMYKNYLDVQNKQKQGIKTQVIQPEGYRYPEVYPSNIYREDNVNHNPYLYKSQEAGNIGVLNPQVPYSFYDKRIAPTKKDLWVNDDYNDGVVNYGYDFGENYAPKPKGNLKPTTKNIVKKDTIKKPKQSNIAFTRPIDRMVVENQKPINIYQQGGIIKDDNGYWNPNNWGNPVEIGSNDITMEGVYEPLLGVSDTGDTQMMYPGQNYKFKGNKVIEYPIAKNGIRQEQKGLKNLDDLTNFTNYNKPNKNWLNKY